MIVEAARNAATLFAALAVVVFAGVAIAKLLGLDVDGDEEVDR